jgi:hypothetical protein
LGFFYNSINTQNEGWRAGIVLQNLGPKINYSNDPQNKSYLPANLGLGINYTKKITDNQHLSFGLEINKLMVPDPPTLTGNILTDSNNLAVYKNYSLIDSWFNSFATDLSPFKSLQTSLGIEYNFSNQFWLRGGYFYESKERGIEDIIMLGLDFIIKQLPPIFLI